MLRIQHAFHAGRLLLAAILGLGLVQGRLSTSGWWAVLVGLAALAAVALAVHGLLNRNDAAARVPSDWLFIVIDSVLALGVITLLSDGAAPLAWVALVVPVAEAALAFNLGTAIAVWGVIGLCHLTWVFTRTGVGVEQNDSLLYWFQQILAVLLLAIPAAVLAGSARAQLRRLATANAQASRDTEALRTVGLTVGRMNAMSTSEEVLQTCVEGVVDLGYVAADIVGQASDGWSVEVARGPLDRPVVEPPVLAQTAATRGSEVELLPIGVEERQLLHHYRAGFAYAFPLATTDFETTGVLRVWASPESSPEDHDIESLRLLASQAARINSTALATARAEVRTQELAFQALHDPLTSLANHRSIIRTLRGLNADHSASVFFIDLDGFKPVNDTYGHEAGDQALTIVSRRLQRIVGERGTVGRIGGDEFVVVGATEQLAIEGETFGLGTEMLDAIREPMAINGKKITLGASIGATAQQGERISAEELLRRADEAMYQAKQAQTGFSTWETTPAEASGVGS